MGMDVSASVFYGLAFEYDSPDYYKFEWDEDGDEPEPEEGSPARLAFWGSSSGEVKHTWGGSYDYKTHAIYVGRKFFSGYWTAGSVDPAEMTPPPDADEMLRAYCERWGLTYSKPQWWIAPKYA